MRDVIDRIDKWLYKVKRWMVGWMEEVKERHVVNVVQKEDWPEGPGFVIHFRCAKGEE